MVTRVSFVRLIARCFVVPYQQGVGEKKKKKTRVKDMNMFQIQTLILPLIFWSRLVTGQLKTQVLKQVPLGRGTCINLQVFATGEIITTLFLNQAPRTCTFVAFIRK